MPKTPFKMTDSVKDLLSRIDRHRDQVIHHEQCVKDLIKLYDKHMAEAAKEHIARTGEAPNVLMTLTQIAIMRGIGPQAAQNHAREAFGGTVKRGHRGRDLFGRQQYPLRPIHQFYLKNAKGRGRPTGSLSDKKVELIQALYRGGMSVRKIAKHVDASEASVIANLPAYEPPIAAE